MASQLTGFDEGCTVSQQLGDVGVPSLRVEVCHSVHRNVPGHQLLVRAGLRESQQHGEQQEAAKRSIIVILRSGTPSINGNDQSGNPSVRDVAMER